MFLRNERKEERIALSVSSIVPKISISHNSSQRLARAYKVHGRAHLTPTKSQRRGAPARRIAPCRVASARTKAGVPRVIVRDLTSDRAKYGSVCVKRGASARKPPSDIQAPFSKAPGPTRGVTLAGWCLFQASRKESPANNDGARVRYMDPLGCKNAPYLVIPPPPPLPPLCLLPPSFYSL